jgi:tight adherence protein B
VTGRLDTIWPVSTAAALTAAVVARAVSAEVVGLLADRDGRALGAAVTCLADELRAGQRPAAALTAAARATDRPSVVRLFTAAAGASTLGGDVPAALRAEGGRPDSAATVTAGVDMLAAAWAVSDRSGAPLADVLDRADADLRSRDRQRQLVAGQLAGPRATAAVLAALPVLGVGLAAGSGGRPLVILFGTRAGQAALMAGAVFQAVGTLWSMRIIRSAARQ